MSTDCGCGGSAAVTGAGPCAGPSTCGCCEGIAALTPVTIINRPGLSQLSYRVGTHGEFLATMLAGLSGAAEPALHALTVRAEDDPSIAFLDCWATIADVLTFYTERIANEGYLRTATELRSVLELARLVGYRLRPGLGASAYLAYTLTANPAKVTSVTIPQGAQAMSVPGPGQQAQTYETSDDLYAQQPWNTLPVRQTKPASVNETLLTSRQAAVTVTGTALSIHPGDRMVFWVTPVEPRSTRTAMSVQAVTEDATASVTTLTLLPDPPPSASTTGDATSGSTGAADGGASGTPAAGIAGSGSAAATEDAVTERDGALPGLAGLIMPLREPPSIPPADSAHLSRTVQSIFGAGSDVAPQLLTGLVPQLGPSLYQAWSQATIPPGTVFQNVAVQRVKAGVFGATAPRQPVLDASGTVVGTREWALSGGITVRIDVTAAANTDTTAPTVAVTASDNNSRAGGSSFAADSPPSEPVSLLPDPGGVTMTVGATQLQSWQLTFAFSGSISSAISMSANNDLTSLAVAIDSDAFTPAPGQTLQASTASGYQVASLSSATDAPAHLVVSIDSWNAPPQLDVIDLDAEYDQVVPGPGSWAVVERADTGAVIPAQVLAVATVARSDYNISGKVTRLTLDQPWLEPGDLLLSVARSTAVYVQSQPLTLARKADTSPVQGDSVELDGLYGGLQTGRWLIITGERDGLPGVTTGEVVMVAGVSQGASLPGDTVHTTVKLATKLAYSYTRDTVTIWGNVVAATQGATQNDVLGSGAASQTGQSFPLSRSPLTYLPAPTAAGAASTLVTAVDAASWQEVDNLVSAGPADHVYMTQTDAAGKTTVLFGDGVHGARVPTGAANVTAAYRVGLGTAGNVAAGQISQPQTRPQGVQGVTNPLPASGGTDPDSVTQVQGNAPLAVMALDRVVSVEDYQDFARVWAGIGKASSVLLSDGSQQFVHLTIGGTTAQPIETSSDLYANLVASLAANGDPHLPVRVAPCQVCLIVMAARIHIASQYQWSDVSAAARDALLAAYSYDNRSLGQDVVLSDIVATLQAVAGVDYAVVTGLAVVAFSGPDSTVAALTGLSRALGKPPKARITVSFATIGSGSSHAVTPAQVAILSPDIADSLVLTQITP